MKTVRIIARNYQAFFPIIQIDGKQVELKYDKKMRCHVGSVTIDADSVKLHIFKWYELSDKKWAVKGFVNWLLSLGGLLSAGYEKVCPTLDIELDVETPMDNNQVLLAFYAPRTNAAAFAMTVNDQAVAVVGNEYKIDTDAIKHRKKTRLLSAFGFILVASLTATLIILSII